MKTQYKIDLIFDSGKYKPYLEVLLLILLIIGVIGFPISFIILKSSLLDIISGIIALLLGSFGYYYARVVVYRNNEYQFYYDKVIIKNKGNINVIPIKNIKDLKIENLTMNIKYYQDGNIIEEELIIGISEIHKTGKIKKGFRDFLEIFEQKRTKK